MASTSSLPEKDLSCPVCHDIFTDPVLLSCSHSFCKACLQTWWRQKAAKECPLCKKINSTEPPGNLALKNLCEAFLQERQQRASKRKRTPSGSEDVCGLHTEKLKLFCLGCQQPVCVVCRDSKKHTDHSFRPVDEAALDYMEEVRTSLKPLQDKLEVFNTFKANYCQTAGHIRFWISRVEMQIKEQFKKMHLFLQEEEEAKIAALREEEQQKSQMMTEKIDSLNTDISTLSDTIRAIEEELRAEHISFLQNYKTTVERVQLTLPDPQPVSGALIDVTKHLGNLTFRVWDKMKDIVSYTPVILDPNTAHPQLILSDDLTSVRWQSLTEWQSLREMQLAFQTNKQTAVPENPERFIWRCRVLGSEGFNSGIHSWDVQVGDNTCWAVGVLAESVQRKGVTEGQFWSIAYTDGKYTAGSSQGSDCDLSVEQKPQRVRVQLDWDQGKLSFSDPDTDTHLHTFTQSFTDALFPYVQTSASQTLPLKILPRAICVDPGDVVGLEDDEDGGDDTATADAATSTEPDAVVVIDDADSGGHRRQVSPAPLRTRVVSSSRVLRAAPYRGTRGGPEPESRSRPA